LKTRSTINYETGQPLAAKPSNGFTSGTSSDGGIFNLI